MQSYCWFYELVTVLHCSQDRIRTCIKMPRTSLDGLEIFVYFGIHHIVNQLHHLTILFYINTSVTTIIVNELMSNSNPRPTKTLSPIFIWQISFKNSFISIFYLVVSARFELAIISISTLIKQRFRCTSVRKFLHQCFGACSNSPPDYIIYNSYPVAD